VQLAQTARGAVGWETGFKLVKVGAGWAFASNGQLCLFLDEAGQYTPRDARLGEGVAVQVPRVRENLVPLRLTLQGGAGGCEHGEPFVKLFVAATTVGARMVLEALAARPSESLAFSAYVCNEPKDYARADTVVVDVPRVFEASVVRLLGEAARASPDGLRPLVPLFARELMRGISRAEALGREDKADGFGLRRAGWLAESVLQALAVGEKSPAEWRARLPGALNRA
jgi:HopA1 effector protein family